MPISDPFSFKIQYKIFYPKGNCPYLYYPVMIRKNEYVLDYLNEDLTSCGHICFSNVILKLFNYL